MLQTLFGEIKNFLDKDFLFASLIPSLVFLACIAATLGSVVGFEGSLGWIDTLTPAQSTMLVVGSFLSTVVFAYIINSLRMVFLKLWAGAITGPFTPFLLLGQRWNQAKYNEEAEFAYRVPEWKAIIEQFDDDMRQRYKEPSTDNSIPNLELGALRSKIRKAGLGSTMKNLDAVTFLKNTVLPVFDQFGWSDSLNDIYQRLVFAFEKKAIEERSGSGNLNKPLGGESATVDALTGR